MTKGSPKGLPWFLQMSLTNDLLFHGNGAGAAGRTLNAIAQLADVDLQLGDGAAECIAVHAQFTGGPALVPPVFLKNGQDEALLEFPYAFGVEDVAAVHLKDKCFQLIFHDEFLSILEICWTCHRSLFRRRRRRAAKLLGGLMEQTESLIKTHPQFRRSQPDRRTPDDKKIRRQLRILEQL